MPRDTNEQIQRHLAEIQQSGIVSPDSLSKIATDYKAISKELETLRSSLNSLTEAQKSITGGVSDQIKELERQESQIEHTISTLAKMANQYKKLKENVSSVSEIKGLKAIREEANKVLKGLELLSHSTKDIRNNMRNMIPANEIIKQSRSLQELHNLLGGIRGEVGSDMSVEGFQKLEKMVSDVYSSVAELSNLLKGDFEAKVDVKMPPIQDISVDDIDVVVKTNIESSEDIDIAIGAKTQHNFDDLSNSIEKMGDSGLNIDVDETDVDNLEQSLEKIGILLENISEKGFMDNLRESFKDFTKTQEYIASWGESIEDVRRAYDEVANLKKEFTKPETISVDDLEKLSDAEKKSYDDSMRRYNNLLEEMKKIKNMHQEVEKIVEESSQDEEIVKAIKLKLFTKPETMKTPDEAPHQEFDKETHETLFGRATKDAREEAERFKNQLAEGAMGATAFGVAIAFASTKITEFSRGILESAKTFAAYNVQIDRIAKSSVIAPQGLEDLERFRKDLRLTTDEATNLYAVMAVGAQSGVINVSELRDAATLLEQTFGEDPTKRLDEYINLLKEIPTLEADLSIDAKMTDQVETLFALAKSGKATQMIEFQLAGLAGADGLNPDEMEGNKTEVATLQSIRGLNTTVESVQKEIIDATQGFMPMVAMTGTIAGGILTAGGSLAAIYSSFIGMSTLVSSISDKSDEQTTAIGRVEDAVYRTHREESGGSMSPTKIKGQEAIQTRAVEMGMRKSLSGFLQKGGGSMMGKAAGMGTVKGSVVSGIGGGVAKLGMPIMAMKGAGAASAGAGAGATSVGAMGAGAGLTGVKLGAAKLGAGLATVLGPITAAVAPLYLVGKYGEDVGSALQDTSKSIEGSTFDEITGALSYLSPLGLGFKIITGETLTFSKMLSWSGEQLEFVGSWWADAGRSLSRGWDDFWTSPEQKKARAEAADESNKLLMEQEKQRKQLVDMQRAALAMEEGLNAITAAANNQKTELAKLTSEVAVARISDLGAIGGNLMQFTSAVNDAVEGFTRQFDITSTGLNKARENIMKDERLNASHKNAMLLEVTRQELKVRQDYIDGVLASMGQFDKIPEVVSNTLQSRLVEATSKLQLDFGVGMGGVGADALLTQIGNAMDSINQMNRAIPMELNNQVQALEHMSEAGTIRPEAFSSSLANLQTEGTTTLDADNIITSLQNDIDWDSDRLTFRTDGVLEGANEGIEREIGRLQSEISDLEIDAELPELTNFQSLIAEQDSVASQIQLANKAQEKATRLMSGYNKGTEGWHEHNTKRIESEREQNELLEESSNITRKIQENQEVALRSAKQLGVVDANKTTLSKEERDRTIELLRQRSEQVNGLQANIAALRTIQTGVQSSTNIQNQTNQQLNQSVRSIEAQVDQLRNYFSLIQNLSSVIERDPVAQHYKRLAGLMESEAEVAMSTGQGFSGFADAAESDLKSASAKMEVGQNFLAKLQKDLPFTELFESGVTAASNVFEDLQSEINKTNDLDIDTEGFGNTFKSSMEQISKAVGIIESDAPREDKDAARRIAQVELANLQQIRDTVQESLDSLPEGIDRAPLEAILAQYQASIEQVSMMSGGREFAEIGAQKAVADARLEQIKALEDLGKAYERINEEPIIRVNQAIVDMQEAAASAAIATGDFAGVQEATSRAVGAAGVIYQKQMQGIEDTLVKGLQIAQDELGSALEGGDEGRIAAARLVIARRIEEIDKARAVASENHLKTTVAITKRMTEAAMVHVDLAEEALGIQKSMYESMGANASIIFALQQEEVALAVKRRDLLAEQLEMLPEAMRGTAEYARMQLEYQKQAADVVQKSMGAQRGAFEKLISHAFGAVRGERGARTGLQSRGRMFGREGAVFDAEGAFVSTGARTIEDRQAQMAVAGGGFRPGKQYTARSPVEGGLRSGGRHVPATVQARDASEIMRESAGTVARQEDYAVQATGYAPIRSEAAETVTREELRPVEVAPIMEEFSRQDTERENAMSKQREEERDRKSMKDITVKDFKDAVRDGFIEAMMGTPEDIFGVKEDGEEGDQKAQEKARVDIDYNQHADSGGEGRQGLYSVIRDAVYDALVDWGGEDGSSFGAVKEASDEIAKERTQQEENEATSRQSSQVVSSDEIAKERTQQEEIVAKSLVSEQPEPSEQQVVAAPEAAVVQTIEEPIVDMAERQEETRKRALEKRDETDKLRKKKDSGEITQEQYNEQWDTVNQKYDDKSRETMHGWEERKAVVGQTTDFGALAETISEAGRALGDSAIDKRKFDEPSLTGSVWNMLSTSAGKNKVKADADYSSKLKEFRVLKSSVIGMEDSDKKDNFLRLIGVIEKDNEDRKQFARGNRQVTATNLNSNKNEIKTLVEEIKQIDTVGADSGAAVVKTVEEPSVEEREFDEPSWARRIEEKPEAKVEPRTEVTPEVEANKLNEEKEEREEITTQPEQQVGADSGAAVVKTVEEPIIENREFDEPSWARRIEEKPEAKVEPRTEVIPEFEANKLNEEKEEREEITTRPEQQEDVAARAPDREPEGKSKEREVRSRDSSADIESHRDEINRRREELMSRGDEFFEAREGVAQSDYDPRDTGLHLALLKTEIEDAKRKEEEPMRLEVPDQSLAIRGDDDIEEQKNTSRRQMEIIDEIKRQRESLEEREANGGLPLIDSKSKVERTESQRDEINRRREELMSRGDEFFEAREGVTQSDYDPRDTGRQLALLKTEIEDAKRKEEEPMRADRENHRAYIHEPAPSRMDRLERQNGEEVQRTLGGDVGLSNIGGREDITGNIEVTVDVESQASVSLNSDLLKDQIVRTVKKDVSIKQDFARYNRTNI